MANSVDPDQTAPIGAVCSRSTLFLSILISSVMLGNYLQQMNTADVIFQMIFFLGPLRETLTTKNCHYGFWPSMTQPSLLIYRDLLEYRNFACSKFINHAF